MKGFLSSCAVFLILLSPHSSVAGNKAAVQPEDALRAAEAFLSKPAAPDSRDNIATFLDYAEASNDVTIVLKEDFIPVVALEDRPENSELLLAAHVAGCLRHQLANPQDRPSPLPGVKTQIEVYRKLRDHSKIDRIDILEKWAGLSETGLEKKITLLDSLHFPEEIGSLHFVNRTDYATKELGYGLFYRLEDAVKAHIYIYDQGIRNLPGGIESPHVANEFEATLAMIKEAEKRGHYLDVREIMNKPLTVETAGISFLHSRVGFQQKSEDGEISSPQISDTFLTAAHGNFIKIRITLEETLLESHGKTLHEFVSGIARHLRKLEQ